MSKKRKLARALAGAAALYGASKLMGMGSGTTGKATVSDAQKTTQVPKIKRPTRVIDSGSKTMFPSHDLYSFFNFLISLSNFLCFFFYFSWKRIYINSSFYFTANHSF